MGLPGLDGLDEGVVDEDVLLLRLHQTVSLPSATTRISSVFQIEVTLGYFSIITYIIC